MTHIYKRFLSFIALSRTRRTYYHYPYLSIAAGISYITLLSITHHNTQCHYENNMKKQYMELKNEIEEVKSRYV
jgi:hypothetical protein